MRQGSGPTSRDFRVSKVALVTGGSRGIGAAIVLRLASDGYDVAFCYQGAEESAARLAKQARELGSTALPTQVDISDPTATRAWVAQVEQDLGAIDVVVASAGITRDAIFARMTDAQWSEVLDVNLDGAYNVSRYAIYPMIRRKAGCVVVISSVAGVYGSVGQVNYSASKAGIIGFARALAKEVGRYGIRVNAVAPGIIETDVTRPLLPRHQERWVNAIPLGRLGQAGEVADLVSFLVSERASYITGSVLEIHGGLTS